MPPRPSVIASTVALVGVPFVFGLFVYWSYQYSLARGGLPSTVLPSELWFVGFASALLAGLIAILALPSRPLWRRLFLAVLYVPAMGVALLIVHLLVACWNGDCV